MKFMKQKAICLAFLAATLMPHSAQATTVTLTVEGIFDPWLAGMPDGSTASSGDIAPDHSPILVTGLPLNAGDALTFSATGSVSNTPSPSGLTPDGGAVFPHQAGAQNGISNIFAPVNSLIGVFLDNAQPDGTAAPGALDFSSAASREFESLSPLLKQVFFIGDGENSAFTQHEFIVPTGATRLYLGTMDGFGWFNNSGSFEVTIKAPMSGQIPLPAGGLLLLTGLGAFAIGRRL